MKISIALPKIHSKEQLDNAYAYSEEVLFYNDYKELQSSKSPMLYLQSEETIVKWDKNPCTYACVSDGQWIDKQERFLHVNDKSKNTSLIIKSKKLNIPNFKNKNLKNLYDEKNFDRFILEAEKYIFDDIRNLNIILRYYLAIIHYFKIKNSKRAQEHIEFILKNKIDFAECWCLLGDILVDSKMFLEAKAQYENALAYGKTRDIYDDIPVCLKKYKDYPLSMIDNLKTLINQGKVLSLNNV